MGPSIEPERKRPPRPEAQSGLVRRHVVHARSSPDAGDRRVRRPAEGGLRGARLLAAIVTVAGSLLPWVSPARLWEHWSYRPAIATLIMGGLASLLIVAGSYGSLTEALMVLIAAAAAVGFFDVATLNSLRFDPELSARPGAGLYLTLMGGVSGFALGLYARSNGRARRLGLEPRETRP